MSSLRGASSRQLAAERVEAGLAALEAHLARVDRRLLGGVVLERLGPHLDRLVERRLRGVRGAGGLVVHAAGLLDQLVALGRADAVAAARGGLVATGSLALVVAALGALVIL